MVKLTLIRPNIGRMEHSLFVDEARMEPLSLGVIAGLTPPDVEVVLYDDRMESIPYDEPTDLVALTVETFTARRAYEISAEFRTLRSLYRLGIYALYNPLFRKETFRKHGLRFGLH